MGITDRGLRAALAAAEKPARQRLKAALEADGIDTLEVAAVHDLVVLEGRRTIDAAVFAFDAELLVSPTELIELRISFQELPVVVVSAERNQRVVRKVLRAGANGFVHDEDVEAALAVAVRAAVAGQVCVPVESRQGVVRAVISHREKQVLELAARGYTNLQIAQELFLAESTVKSHLSTCFRKLGVRSRAEAAALVLDPELRVELGLAELSTVDPLVTSI